jgi:hypothetical protein
VEDFSVQATYQSRSVFEASRFFIAPNWRRHLNIFSSVCSVAWWPGGSLSRRGSRVEDGDVGQVAVPFVVIEAVADDESIVDREADILNMDVDLPS